MKTIIPQETRTTCDVCSRVCVGGNYKKQARLTLKRDALDMLGDPCADATVILDLCDKCETKVSKAINLVKENE